MLHTDELQKYEATIIAEEKIAANAYRYELKTDKDVSFVPGQYLMVSDGKLKRPYSISSAPGRPLELTMKRGSGLVDSMKLGVKLSLEGPFGSMTFQEGEDRIVFISGGTGIAPFMSMMRHIHLHKLKVDILNICSYRYVNDVLYLDELGSYDQMNIVTITDEEAPGWDGERGRIDRSFLEKYTHEKDSLFYVCGPESMVLEMELYLRELGVAGARIVRERW